MNRVGLAVVAVSTLVGAVACGDATGPLTAEADACSPDSNRYAEAFSSDGWVVEDPSPILGSAFPDPAIGEPLLFPPIVDLKGIHEANASVFTLQAGFESAFDCIEAVSASSISPAEGGHQLIEVSFEYHGFRRHVFAYGTLPTTCTAAGSAALVIPGSGHNQSSAIVKELPSNYHYGVLDALEGVDHVFTLIKPNEDVLAWHNGAGRKLDGTLIWNWHLNREGSYSVSYLVQAMAVQKWMSGCFATTITAGLSQGGAAALITGLQSGPDAVVVSAGHSLLFNEAEWAGPDQLTGVPGLARLFRGGPLAEALSKSPSRWMFAYGRADADVYRIEAKTGLTAGYIDHLPNVEVVVHDGGHVFPVAEMKSFLDRLGGT